MWSCSSEKKQASGLQVESAADDHGDFRSDDADDGRRQPIGHGEGAVDDGQAGEAVAVVRRIVQLEALDDRLLRAFQFCKVVKYWTLQRGQPSSLAVVFFSSWS